MCAQYIIKAKLKELEKLYGIKIPKNPEYFDEKVVPYKLGPVIVNDGKNNVVKLMRFSLLPVWSKDPKVKFATHNARLESMAEKPTWKRPLQNYRCLVPISQFIEPIYVKAHAGNMVRFFDNEEPILTAAGVYDQWTDKETGEVIDSFAVITDDPIPFVKKIGHDRSPVFLAPSAFEEWLKPEKRDADELTVFLKDHKAQLHLDVENDRPMRPGWEKRIPKD